MSTDITTLDLSQLALLAEAQLENEATVSNGPQMLSTRNGRLSLNGTPIVGDMVQAIVLCAPFENLYYDSAFNSAELVPPKCSAMAVQQMELAPVPSAIEPQHPDCFSCKMNQWGSSTTGSRKGKACRNTRRITFLAASDVVSPASVSAAQSFAIRPPVTSVAAYGDYSKKLAMALKKPAFAVITEIRLVPDAKSQFRVEFKLVEEIKDQEILVALMNRSSNEIENLIAQSQAIRNDGESEEAQSASVEDKEVF